MDTRLAEKKDVWGWRDLSYMLVMVLVAVPLFIEYGLANYLADFLQNDLHAGTLTGLVMAIIFLAGLYLIVLKPNAQSWKAVGVQRFSKKDWKLIIGWTIILIIASVLLMIIVSFFEVGTENSKTESLRSQLTFMNFIIGFVSASIISPIYEEIFYRGFLYRFFSSRYGILIGMLASSIIFTLVHIPTFNTLPVNFVSGLIFAWVYQKTGSVIPCMLIHGTFNGIAVVLTFLS